MPSKHNFEVGCNPISKEVAFTYKMDCMFVLISTEVRFSCEMANMFPMKWSFPVEKPKNHLSIHHV